MAARSPRRQRTEADPAGVGIAYISGADRILPDCVPPPSSTLVIGKIIILFQCIDPMSGDFARPVTFKWHETCVACFYRYGVARLGQSEGSVEQGAFTETLGVIYDTAVAPERWPELLQRLGRDFRCHFAGMVASNADRSVFDGMAVGVDREVHQAFLRRHHQNSALRLAAPPKLTGEVIDSEAIMPRAAFERTEIYQDFFRPHDMGIGLRLTLWQGEAGAHTMSLVRSWKAGSFDGSEHFLANHLMPHLQRAAAVARHMRAADLLTRSAHAVLDAVQQPVLLLGRDGQLIHANASAEALLRAADGLTVLRCLLKGAAPAATRALEALVAAAAARPGIGGTIRLQRPSGRAPLVVMAMPMRGLDDFALEAHPAVLVCISDPTQRPEIDPRLLMELFGLTPAEATLAQQLLAGHELKTIAGTNRRNVSAVRSVLTRLMAKTETSAQSELVRMLDRMPRIKRDG
jgi:DNA-binding CsgD family transcriptional regulator/PAS domain-containing protein